MQKLKSVGVALVAGALAIGSSGCLKKLLLDGQIKSTRTASAAVNSISDYEVARGAAMAGLAQFEGMHYLAPYNQDGMFLLARGWAGTAFGFIEDEMEQAEDLYGEESELVEYHKARAVAAYARAGHYAKMLLEAKNPGFEAAQKNVTTMQGWTAKFTDPEDAGDLLWAGQAWLSPINLLKDDMQEVGKLYVGVELVRRSVELDDSYNHATGHTILGAYHSRSPGSPELEDGKKHFEAALAIHGGKMLLTKFNYATKYFCNKIDRDGYVKALNEILEAGDVLPEQRLPNTIAKRRARRHLSPKRMKECGFPNSPATEPAQPAKPSGDDDKD